MPRLPEAVSWRLSARPRPEVDACGKVSFSVKLAQIDPKTKKADVKFLLDGQSSKTPKPRKGSVYELNFRERQGGRKMRTALSC